MTAATRRAGLDRLAEVTPRLGRAYTEGRNTDPGPDSPGAVSQLSPYLRHRLITEDEVIRAAHQAHGEAAAMFIQEVVWRSYWKGWLAQHPSVWIAYLAEAARDRDRLATEGGLRRVYDDACDGRTGIDGFDDWARALVATNNLHNHARMWFASIWIFTLRLPWTLGAAFFLRHLLDGDAASNTLSWRWVAGLHTKGKHYVARADNIARYTNGRFDPRGQLDEAPEPLTETAIFPRIALPSADALPDGRFDLLLHDDDLCPETLGLDPDRIGRLAVLDTATGADPVTLFRRSALADAAARLGRTPEIVTPETLGGWLAGDHPVVTPWAPDGRNATALSNHNLLRLRRAWDGKVWPHCTRGFFQLRAHIPDFIATLDWT
jgi:deoxyribodipyrimidine photo-lyase